MKGRITVAAASVALLALAACSRGDNNAFDSAGGTAGAMATPPATTPSTTTPSSSVGTTTTVGGSTVVIDSMGMTTKVRVDTTKTTKRP